MGKDVVRKISYAIIDSQTDTLTTLGTFWTRYRTPDLTGGAAPTVAGPAPHATNIATVLGYVTWIGLALAVLSLIALGGLLAVRMRTGEGIAALGRMGAVLGGVLLLSGATSVVTHALPAGPHGVGGATGFIQSALWWYMAAAATASVLIGAIRMIWEQRAHPGRELVRSLLTLIVVAGAGVTIVNMLITAADSFSVWVIDQGMRCGPEDSQCFVNSVKRILKISEGDGTFDGTLLMIIIGLVALLSDLIQIVLMVARSGMLVLLTGVLPIAAAATNTEMGKLWFKRCVSWLVAFLLYKPIASLIYAAAFKLVTNQLRTEDELLSMLTGTMLMLLAVLALPALLRFVAPMASAASSGHASGAAVMMAAARLPSGARSTATHESARSSTTTSAPSGSTNPSATGAGSGAGPSGSGGGSGGPAGTAQTGRSGGGSAPRQSAGNPHTTGSAPNGSSGSAGSTDAGAAQPDGAQTVTTTTTENTRGRRYSDGPGASGRALQGAALAAGAVHAITEESTGSGG
ncbi:hypothetical protein GJV80_15600 [Microlunatus sp. Gsoil 973]|nr:hypothetical protein GJV80_15600 [Microlunatus sp. Gsoil 973]